ncbi:MAG: LapA family protein [Fidelibacterota bacterium]
MEKSMQWKMILWGIIVVLLIIFIIQNVAVMDLKFLFWKMSMSRSLMMFFLVIIGIAIGWFWKGVSVRRKKRDQQILEELPKS